MSPDGDLIAHYERRAAEQDMRLRRQKSDTRMVGGKSLGDALGEALHGIAGRGGDLSSKSGAAGLNFDVAAKHLFTRAAFLGLPSQDHIVEKARAEVAKGLDLCESPIEKRLLPWLVCEDYGPHVLTCPVPVCNTKLDELPPKGDLFIVPQFAFVKFRMDFALVRRMAGGRLGIVAVECDGSGHHNAVRDTLRNGWLASFQIKTIRAMGSTINERPREVSARVAEAVMELEA